MGSLSLLYKGQEDTYLTGSPQITNFKTVYKRYTPFSIKYIKQTIIPLSPSPLTSTNITCNISKTGSLLQHMWIKIKDFSPITTCAFQAESIISNVEFRIGTQTIDSYDSTWSRLFSETLLHVQQKENWNKLVNARKTNDEIYVSENRGVILPLVFFFNNYSTSALPVCALTLSESIQIIITLNKQGNWDSGYLKTEFTGEWLEVWGEYIFLEPEEEQKFKQGEIQYLITQVQSTGNMDIRNPPLTINFKHPVKSLTWCFPNTQVNQHGNFSMNSRTLPLSFQTGIPFRSITMDFAGNLAAQDDSLLNTQTSFGQCSNVNPPTYILVDPTDGSPIDTTAGTSTDLWTNVSGDSSSYVVNTSGKSLYVTQYSATTITPPSIPPVKIKPLIHPLYGGLLLQDDTSNTTSTFITDTVSSGHGINSMMSIIPGTDAAYIEATLFIYNSTYTGIDKIPPDFGSFFDNVNTCYVGFSFFTVPPSQFVTPSTLTTPGIYLGYTFSGITPSVYLISVDSNTTPQQIDLSSRIPEVNTYTKYDQITFRLFINQDKSCDLFYQFGIVNGPNPENTFNVENFKQIILSPTEKAKAIFMPSVTKDHPVFCRPFVECSRTLPVTDKMQLLLQNIKMTTFTRDGGGQHQIAADYDTHIHGLDTFTEELAPLESLKITIDGTELIDETGLFYNAMQPYISPGPGTASHGIYCYNFSLNPTQSQPSGHLNFSKLNNMVFECTMKDKNPDRINNFIRVYGVNYNILSVKDGQGHVLYN